MTLSNYQVRIGLAQYAGAGTYRHFLGPYQPSPYLIVFSAFIYCLKNNDSEAALLLSDIARELKAKEAL